MRAHHIKRDGVTYCTKHDALFVEERNCFECLAEETRTAIGKMVARNRTVQDAKSKGLYCETHDEIFETECQSCAMWRANTLDQDVQETLTAKASDAPQPPDGWVDWNGGECPVNRSLEVEILRRDGEVLSAPAGWFVWGHHFGVFDIIRYRLPQAAPSEPQSALQVQEGGDHYKKLKIQPVEYIHANGLPFAEGSVVKYVTRWRDKNGVADLKKARHFLDLLIELETKATK